MDDSVKKDLQEIRNYFTNIRNILKDFKTSPGEDFIADNDKIFKLLEAGTNDAIKMRNLLKKCEINYYESISDTKEKKMYLDMMKNLSMKGNKPYIPIELLNDGPCISFGNIDGLSCKNLDIFMPTNNQSYTFSNNHKEYCLMNYNDLLEIQKNYKRIFLLDNIFYTKTPRSSSIEQTQFSSVVHLFNYYFDRLEENKEEFYYYYDLFDRIADMINLITNNYFSKYKTFTGINSMRWLLEKFDNVYIFDYHHTIPIKNYSTTLVNLIHFNYDSWKDDSLRRGYITTNLNEITEQIISKEDNGYIIVNLRNLKNIVNKTHNYDNNDGYLLVSKSNPMNITPVNVSKEDYGWLTNFIEICNLGWPFSNHSPNFRNPYYKYFLNALSISSQTIEDVFFTYCFINGGNTECERADEKLKFIPINLEKPIFNQINQSYDIPFNEQIVNSHLILYALSMPMYFSSSNIDKLTFDLKFFAADFDHKTNIKNLVIFLKRLYVQFLKYYEIKDNKILIGSYNTILYKNITEILSYYSDYINDSKVKQKILSIPFKNYYFNKFEYGH